MGLTNNEMEPTQCVVGQGENLASLSHACQAPALPRDAVLRLHLINF